MAIRVSPSDTAPTHHISLSDGTTTWGLMLSDGPQSIHEIPMTPSTILVPGGQSKFGDWEPGLAQIAQQTWIGGRGSDDFSIDSSRYNDAESAFTMVDGKIFPVPQWKWGEGYSNAVNKMPGANRIGVGRDVKSVRISSATQYAHQFTSPAALTAAIGYMWIRNIGMPASGINIRIETDSSGEPSGTIVTNGEDTINAADILADGDGWQVIRFDAGNLSNATTYWVVVDTTDTDTGGAYWEVACGTEDTAQAKKSTDSAATWANTNDQIFFRISEAMTAGKRHRFFEYRGSLYMYSRESNVSTATKLYINGDRGKATASSNTSLTDSGKSWTVDRWIGAYVRIIEGTGAGQIRQITDNTATVLTVAAWDVNPSTDSLFVIYGTDEWQDISPGAGDLFDRAVTDHMNANDQVYFARDDSVNLYKMRYTSGTPGHEFRDDTGDNGDYLHSFTDATNGFQLFVGENTTKTLTRFSSVQYSSNLASGTAIDVGDDSANITNVYDYNGTVYVYKEDGLYQISSDKALREDTGLDFVRSPNTGEAVVNRNFFNYFSWGDFALQQMQKNSSLIDMASIGPDRGQGLPNDRRGRISALGFHPAGLIAGVDADSERLSSVLIRTDPVGWHEIFRCPIKPTAEVNYDHYRIRDVYWQDCPGTFPRLWIDMGNEVIVQEWPRNALNPLKDTGMNYQHQFQITLADFNMGADRLPKLFKELSVLSENLTEGVSVKVDYQVDEAIGSNTWTPMGEAIRSPESVLDINRGEVKKIRLRLTGITVESTIPPIITATVLEGFARTPLKYQWNMRVSVRDFQSGLSGIPQRADPDEFVNFLKRAARDAIKLRMRAIWKQMDRKDVVAEPPSVFRDYTNNTLRVWGGDLTLSLREY